MDVDTREQREGSKVVASTGDRRSAHSLHPASDPRVSTAVPVHTLIAAASGEHGNVDEDRSAEVSNLQRGQVLPEREREQWGDRTEQRSVRSVKHQVAMYVNDRVAAQLKALLEIVGEGELGCRPHAGGKLVHVACVHPSDGVLGRVGPNAHRSFSGKQRGSLQLHEPVQPLLEAAHDGRDSGSLTSSRGLHDLKERGEERKG
mmetsp:Transcript_18175/g.41244  ORF Transcript_18175/g.41244 Transcript_18175/m.41244 type:complete len:203 (-) Transcript_18175:152-760(-)